MHSAEAKSEASKGYSGPCAPDPALPDVITDDAVAAILIEPPIRTRGSSFSLNLNTSHPLRNPFSIPFSTQMTQSVLRIYTSMNIILILQRVNVFGHRTEGASHQKGLHATGNFSLSRYPHSAPLCKDTGSYLWRRLKKG